MAALALVALLLGACGSGAPTALTAPSSSSTPRSAAAAPSTTVTTTTAPGATTSVRLPDWIIGAWQIPMLEEAGLSASLVKALFNNPGTYLVVSSAGSPGAAQLPLATKVQRFTSFVAMQQAFTAGSVLPGVSAIMYDNEGWSLTPPDEKAQPVQFAAQAQALVHQHGMTFLFTPAVNLAKLSGGTGSKWTEYLNENLAAGGAKVSDVFDIQAQQAQATPEFQPFSDAAVQQARAANPGARILVGIGPDPNGRTISAADILAAYQAVRGEVDGYWLNLPVGGIQCPNCGTAQPSVEAAFLTSLASSLGISPN